MEEKKELRLYSADIIQRFILGKDYEKFVADYMANRKMMGNAQRKATEKDLAILADYKAGITKGRALAEKHGITQSAVMTSLRIAALSKI